MYMRLADFARLPKFSIETEKKLARYMESESACVATTAAAARTPAMQRHWRIAYLKMIAVHRLIQAGAVRRQRTATAGARTPAMQRHWRIAYLKMIAVHRLIQAGAARRQKAVEIGDATAPRAIASRASLDYLPPPQSAPSSSASGSSRPTGGGASPAPALGVGVAAGSSEEGPSMLAALEEEISSAQAALEELDYSSSQDYSALQDSAFERMVSVRDC